MSTGSAPKTDVRKVAVLVVDDERALLDVIRESLQTEFEVETAINAEEADLMMASRTYDAVICDHILPGESGLDFLIRMADRHPKTRRIFLTGYMNPELLSRSVALAKLTACLLKPARAAELSEIIRTTLREVQE